MKKLKVVIPLDGSAFSRQALASVCRVFSPTSFSLYLLRVAPMPEGILGLPPRTLVVGGRATMMYESARDAELAEHPVYASQRWENIRADLINEMKPDMRRLQEAGFSVSSAVRFGEPAQEIADFVEEAEMDLVVMATHGRSGVARAVMGSVAAKVLGSVRVPVMMVRPVKELAPEPLPVMELTEG